MIEGLVIGFAAGGVVFAAIGYHHGYFNGHNDCIIEMGELDMEGDGNEGL